MDISIKAAETGGNPYGKREIVWDPNSYNSKKKKKKVISRNIKRAKREGKTLNI